MTGLEKFEKQINEEVSKIKDDKKKKAIKEQMKQIVDHITSVCDAEYDNLLLQDHKSFRRMWSFVMNNAKEYEVNGCAFVSDPVVYGWVDEYVGLDDKKAVESEMKKQKATSKDVDKTIEKIKAEIEHRHNLEDVSIFDMM